MSHYGTYLGGTLATPGVDRRPPDPPPYGSQQRRCLLALETPRTVAQVALALGWDYQSARSWVKVLRKAGRVVRTSWTITKAGQRAGVDRVVTTR